MNQSFVSTEEAKKADINELLDKLSASKKGLSSSEAKERLQQYALVVTTGMNTYFGKTTKLAEEAKTQSHFQKAAFLLVSKTSKTLVYSSCSHTTYCYINHCLWNFATCDGLGISHFRLGICAGIFCGKRFPKSLFVQVTGT